jgi:hypothetical protein
MELSFGFWIGASETEKERMPDLLITLTALMKAGNTAVVTGASSGMYYKNFGASHCCSCANSYSDYCVVHRRG